MEKEFEDMSLEELEKARDVTLCAIRHYKGELEYLEENDADEDRLDEAGSNLECFEDDLAEIDTLIQKLQEAA